MVYEDKLGYMRHSNLISREKAKEQIWEKNRDKYPLPFSEYVVHHKDENKKNNKIENLQLMTLKEHNDLHKKTKIKKFKKINWVFESKIGKGISF
ncbi:MAG: HNH endonuclease, partial [Nanoarchaeota archaeon]|nr:HNH endonuclease [Nanoarchaeota archaeon]